MAPPGSWRWTRASSPCEADRLQLHVPRARAASSSHREGLDPSSRLSRASPAPPPSPPNPHTPPPLPWSSYDDEEALLTDLRKELNISAPMAHIAAAQSLLNDGDYTFTELAAKHGAVPWPRPEDTYTRIRVRVGASAKRVRGEGRRRMPPPRRALPCTASRAAEGLFSAATLASP